MINKAKLMDQTEVAWLSFAFHHNPTSFPGLHNGFLLKKKAIDLMHNDVKRFDVREECRS